MSGKVSGLVLDHLPGCDHVQLVIALVLADASDHDGSSVRPSVARIATLARVAERTVQYHLRKFEQDGFLVLLRPGGGRGRPAEYNIDLNWLLAQPAVLQTQKGASVAPFVETVQKGCTEPVGNGAKRVQPRVHPTHDPVVLPTTTHHQVVVEELEEMIEAAFWAAPLIKNEVGFRRKVRSRILSEGANAEDLRTLSSWRAQKSKIEANQKQQSPSAACLEIDEIDPVAREKGEKLLSAAMLARIRSGKPEPRLTGEG